MSAPDESPAIMKLRADYDRLVVERDVLKQENENLVSTLHDMQSTHQRTVSLRPDTSRRDVTLTADEYDRLVAERDDARRHYERAHADFTQLLIQRDEWKRTAERRAATTSTPPLPATETEVDAFVATLKRMLERFGDADDDDGKLIERLVKERDKWLNAFNRSEQFQDGPRRELDALRTALAQLEQEMRVDAARHKKQWPKLIDMDGMYEVHEHLTLWADKLQAIREGKK